MGNTVETNQNNFPRWYLWVKSYVPVIMGGLASLWAGLVLSGTLSFAPLLWLSTAYATLEGLQALGALAFAMGALGSMAYLGTALIIRGAFLYPYNENMLTSSFQREKELDTKLKAKEEELKQFTEISDKALENIVKENKDLTAKYNYLKGKSEAEKDELGTVSQQSVQGQKAANADSFEGSSRKKKRK